MEHTFFTRVSVVRFSFRDSLIAFNSSCRMLCDNRSVDTRFIDIFDDRDWPRDVFDARDWSPDRDNRSVDTRFIDIFEVRFGPWDIFDARDWPRVGDSAPDRLGEGECCRDARLSRDRVDISFTKLKIMTKGVALDSCSKNEVSLNLC